MSVCDESSLTSEQRGVLEHITGDTSPSCIIEAVAGCGKTTVLLHFLTRVVSTGKRVLFLAFNVSTVEWARKCLHKDPPRGTTDTVDVQTFHGFAYSMFPGRKLDPDITFRSFCDVLANAPPAPKRSKTSDDASPSEKQTWAAVRRVVQHIRCTGKLPDDYLRCHGEGAAANEMETWVRDIAHHTLKLAISDVSQRIELEDTVYLAAADHAISLPSYDWIVVDEIQDANDAQLILIGRLLAQSGSCRLLAVGDPKQSIYSFRHANDAINRLRGRLDAMNRPVITLKLSVCFRCPQSVIHLARNIQPHMQVANGAIAGTVRLQNVTPANLLRILQQHATSSNGHVLCIMRYNKPILQILWTAFQQGTTAHLRWLSASVLQGMREHLIAMLGINEREDGDLLEVLSGGLIADVDVRALWHKYKQTRSAHVWDMNPVVHQALEQSCSTAWYTFLLEHLCQTMPGDVESGKVTTSHNILLSTIHSTKGITFRGVVAIVDYNTFGITTRGTEPIEDSHLLYVALTRTTKGLLFLFTRDPYHTVSPYFQVDDIRSTTGFVCGQ